MAVIASVIVALLLSVLPIPFWAIPYWPEWILLVVIYWCIALPNHYNIGFAWLCGLATDVLRGNMIGQYGLTYIFVVFIVLLLHRHFRLYPVGQQALMIGLILIPYFLLLLWINHFLNPSDWDWRYWMPLITSMFVWSWVFAILRFVRHKTSQDS